MYFLPIYLTNKGKLQNHNFGFEKNQNKIVIILDLFPPNTTNGDTTKV